MKGYSETLPTNDIFNYLVEPIDHDAPLTVHDADLFITETGAIINAEGWDHLDDAVLGETLYEPRENGNRLIFGHLYQKVTIDPRTRQPIPYRDRRTSPQTKAVHARYKEYFHHSQLVARIPARRPISYLLDLPSVNTHQARRDLRNLLHLIHDLPKDTTIGATGSTALGNLSDYHDLDLVFVNDLEENRWIANRIQALLHFSPARRVTEGGKYWRIRLFNDYQGLMCCFFSYNDPRSAPLLGVEYEIVRPNISIKGRVVNDDHSFYTPSILSIEPDDNTSTTHELPRPFEIIIYHTASRGECRNGERLVATGDLVVVSKRRSSYPALLVTERDAIRNLTPPWRWYYASPGRT